MKKHKAVLIKVLSLGFIFTSLVSCNGNTKENGKGDRIGKRKNGKNVVSVICQCGEKGKILGQGSNQAEAQAKASEKCKSTSPESSVSACTPILNRKSGTSS